MPSSSGTVGGDGDGGLGEGFHVVEHVEGGVHEAYAKTGGDAAARGKRQREIVALDVEKIGRECGGDSFSKVRDGFRRGIVEYDEAAPFGSGADGAKECGGFDAGCRRQAVQQIEKVAAVFFMAKRFG